MIASMLRRGILVLLATAVTTAAAHAVLATSTPEASDSIVFATSADGQVLRSTDGGGSFEEIGAPVPGGEPRGIAISSDEVDRLWVSAADEGVGARKSATKSAMLKSIS